MNIIIKGYDQKEQLYMVELNGKLEFLTASMIKLVIANNIVEMIDKCLENTDLHTYLTVESIINSAKQKYGMKQYKRSDVE